MQSGQHIFHSPLWINSARSKISQCLGLLLDVGSPSKAISEELLGWFVKWESILVHSLASIFYSKCVHFIWLSSSLAAHYWIILLPLLHWYCSVSEQWTRPAKWSGLKITQQKAQTYIRFAVQMLCGYPAVLVVLVGWFKLLLQLSQATAFDFEKWQESAYLKPTHLLSNGSKNPFPQHWSPAGIQGSWSKYSSAYVLKGPA